MTKLFEWCALFMTCIYSASIYYFIVAFVLWNPNWIENIGTWASIERAMIMVLGVCFVSICIYLCCGHKNR